LTAVSCVVAVVGNHWSSLHWCALE